MYPKTNVVRMTKSGGLFGRDIKTASGKMKNVNKTLFRKPMGRIYSKNLDVDESI
jgi:hypothetical protein